MGIHHANDLQGSVVAHPGDAVPDGGLRDAKALGDGGEWHRSIVLETGDYGTIGFIESVHVRFLPNGDGSCVVSEFRRKGKVKTRFIEGSIGLLASFAVAMHHHPSLA
jgi:hypothetical protein